MLTSILSILNSNTRCSNIDTQRCLAMAIGHLEKHGLGNVAETPDALGLYPHSRRPSLPAQNPALESALGGGSSWQAAQSEVILHVDASFV
ncbi:unnamed protein product [Phytophthora fragariaefolia]|uniref:Unnamed protein product n=1 Tax=Phytophthora fragariaefolia TaxID=1490495 RepID=A0A9W7CVS8_9STRA|nr:unnamed protein product [Phytophthora fragariaefolia]